MRTHLFHPAVSPPAARNPPPFALRPVAPPDEGFLLRLYAMTRADELARTGWDAAQRDVFIRSQYQARRADYALRYPGAEHSLITVNSRDAGVWMVWRTPAEILLVNIELLPEHRGRGIGSALIRGLIAEAKAIRVPLTLSVREENRAASRLYQRLGFSIDARAHGYLMMRHKP